MSPVRIVLLAGLLFIAVAGMAGPALAAGEEPRDQIVLSGTVRVPRGKEIGEVVVFHGTVTIAGVARGDVVVIDGLIEVTGQVSGSVISVNGAVVLGPNAKIGGDVIARDRLRIEAGAIVDGEVRQGTAFTFRTPIDVFGRFAAWLAVVVSTLVLGLLLVGVAPRGADAVARASRTAPWASIGWGLATSISLPVVAVLAIASLVGLPFGLGLLLALAFLYSIGYAWSAFVLGRLLWRSPRNRALAFLFGWGILSAAAAVPYAGGGTWVAGAVFGLGATTVAVWHGRGVRGKHRGRSAPGESTRGEETA